MAGLAFPVLCLSGWLSVSMRSLSGLFSVPMCCLYGWFNVFYALFVWLV